MSAENQSITELRQHIDTLHEQVRALTDEIKAVLHADLPEYVNRELKKSFVSHPKFAQTVTSDTLKTIKSRVAEAGASARNTIMKALNDESLWIPSTVTDAQKSIADNEAVWAIASTIAGTVTELRNEFAFPDANETPAYKPPTWFIERRYLPSLSEKYWRLNQELNEAKRHISHTESLESKGQLARRWEDA